MRNWRALYGPIDQRMPVDVPPPWDGVTHEDWEDRLNSDGTWGVPDVGSPGGSGIVFGYACDDMDIVGLAAIGCYRRTHRYDWEHLIRQYRYDIALWEMDKAPSAARRIVEYGEWMHAAWSETGPTHDGPEWVPQNIAQYRHMAQQKPRSGLPLNARALGWCMYLRAMQHKVARTSAAWSLATLDTLEMASIPGTGQIVVDKHDGIDQAGIQYTFHWSILAMGAMALAHRLRMPVPHWVIDGALAIWEQEPMQYGGFASPPAFLYTKGLNLAPCTGSAQMADPAHGHWGSLCATLYHRTHDPMWLDKATKYGPQLTYTDEQSRKETMLMRGLLL